MKPTKTPNAPAWANALATSVCAAAVLAGHPSHAQTAGGAAVQEIVVTAQRRSEILEKVPMSVSIVSPAALEKAGVDSITELNRVTSGTQFTYGGSVPGIAVRGITSTLSGFNIESNVAVYTDGVYDPAPLSMQADLANIESIQVLKGPQGTLYGRNATGGAFLINTLGPQKTFQGHFDVGYGRFDDKSVDGYVAGPINDRLRYSASVFLRHSDGHIKFNDPQVIGKKGHPALPLNQASVRLKLEGDVTENLTALISYSYIFAQDDRTSVFSQFGHVNTALVPAPPLRPTEFGTVAYNYRQGEYAIQHGVLGKLTYKTPIGVLTSYTAYTHRNNRDDVDFDGSFRDSLYTHSRYTGDNFQQTIDYAINAIDNLDLIVGGMYYHDVYETPKSAGGYFNFTANRNLTFINYFKQKTEAWALYADATYHVTDQLALNVGGRYSHDEKSLDFLQVSPTGAALYSPPKADYTWTKFTPRATVRYEFAPRTDVYASWSRGFRSGTFNISPPTTVATSVPAEPETVTAYELGFKTAQSWVRFQSAVYYYDYKNLQVSLVVPIPGCPTCGAALLLQNAPKAKIYGWDNEVTLTPVEHLTLHAGVTYLHGRYGSFPNATGTGVNSTNTLNVTNQTQDWTHKRLVRAPDWSGNASIDYDIPLSYGSLLLSGSMSFTSSFPISNASLYGPQAPPDLQGKQRLVQDSYAIFNASIRWTSPDDRYSVTFYGNNLTDKSYRMSYNASAFGDYSAKAEPISWSVKLGMRF